MAKRRTIRRIEPAQPDVFDDQQWPVIVAGCVLAAIAMGAVVTVLHGPWMWFGLLGLPALTFAALTFLLRIQNHRLRRSLQLALIISLACHLLLLIMSSLIGIFQIENYSRPQVAAKRTVRTIEFSNNQKNPIPVRQPDPISEPDVELQRDRAAVTAAPQTLPLPESKPTPVPQTKRRQIVQRSVPRFSESLAMLSKNSIRRPEPSPESPPSARSSKATETKASPAKSVAQTNESNQVADVLEKPSRRSQQDPRERIKPMPRSEIQTKTKVAEALNRRSSSIAQPRELKPMSKFKLADRVARPSPPATSIAKTKRPVVKLPNSSDTSGSKAAAAAEASSLASEISRKPASKKQLAAKTPPKLPPLPKLTSIIRPKPSLDKIPQRTVVTPMAKAQPLTDSRRSKSRRSMARAPSPNSAFRVDTESKAKIAGSKSPSVNGFESVAAEVDLTSRSKVAASEPAKMESLSVDIGPTKVMPESQRREFDGEGSRELTQQRIAAALDSIDDEDEEERRRRLLANSLARVSEAPQIRAAEPIVGQRKTAALDSSVATESIESEVEVQRNAGGTLAATDIIRHSATQLAVEAIRSLPMVSPSLSLRESPRRELERSPVEFGAEETASPVGKRPTVAFKPLTPNDPTGSGASSKEPVDADFEPADVELTTRVPRPSDAGLELNIEANPGAAGLAKDPKVDFGVTARPASKESLQPPDIENRFRKTDFGGTPSVNPAVLVEKEAFRRRTPSMAENSAAPKTEAAIHSGLEFLTRFQKQDGRWVLDEFDRQHPLHRRQLNSDMAATGLAVLAYQGAGYNHREFKYSRQLNHAIRWLIQNQGDDGGLYLESDEKSDAACRLYSHGIAALALTEAYGMTQDPMLKEPAQKALDYIAESQHPETGGWRYFAMKKKLSSDTSVSGWMMMALQSGRLAGLKVEDKSFKGIEGWLKVAADPANESLYRYNPYAVNSQGVSRVQGRNATPAMTSVGLLMRIYGGWERDDPRLISGARFLLQQQAPGETKELRDTYYWYYATQVLKHVDGDLWQQWDQQLRPLLTRTQEKTGDYAGSWHPYGPVPDRWGPFGGRLYVTTMNLLSLEVRHRLLPLYEKTNTDEAKTDRPKVIEIQGKTE